MLHQRELQILDLMAKYGIPVISQDIAIDSKISQSTIQAVFRKLLNEGYIENVGVTHSGNVLSRQFVPTEKVKTDVINQMVELYSGVQNIVSADEIYEAIKNKN